MLPARKTYQKKCRALRPLRCLQNTLPKIAERSVLCAAFRNASNKNCRALRPMGRLRNRFQKIAERSALCAAYINASKKCRAHRHMCCLQSKIHTKPRAYYRRKHKDARTKHIQRTTHTHNTHTHTKQIHTSIYNHSCKRSYRPHGPEGSAAEAAAFK